MQVFAVFCCKRFSVKMFGDFQMAEAVIHGIYTTISIVLACFRELNPIFAPRND